MSERDAISGAFKNDVGMGASTPEQQAAGVNPLDNEFSAASKINLHRNPTVHAPMDWAGLATFIRWAFVVFCALVVVWAAAAANEQRVNKEMYGTYPASLLGGESRVSTLFPPGAKIPKASGQALKWEQVKSMQGKALNPTTFESDYCALSHPFNNELARNPSLAARWRVSQNGYCSAEDQSVMKVKLLAHNSMWLMATLAILVIGLGAVFMGARAMRKRYIQA